MVEVWHRDKNSSDVLMGITNISLAEVLKCDRQQISVRFHYSPKISAIF